MRDRRLVFMLAFVGISFVLGSVPLVLSTLSGGEQLVSSPSENPGPANPQDIDDDERAAVDVDERGNSSEPSLSASNPTISTSGAEGSPATTPEVTVEEPASQAEFVHRATPENIVRNSTYVDSPLANDNPDAILLVNQRAGPIAEAGDARPMGVWYDANRGGRWAIFHQDRAPMREDAIFEVIVWEEPGGSVFVHRATGENTVENRTYIDHPSANGRSDAELSITPNWNPGGGAGTYNDHPVDVRYDVDREQWMILNRDLAPVPEGAAFNVDVSDNVPPTN